MIGFGIAGVIIMSVKELVALRFFLACSPLFLMYLFFSLQTLWINAFSSRLQLQNNKKIFSIFEVIFRKRVFQHLVTFLLINSLSTVVFFYFSCGNNSDALAWIAASIIFVLGIFYCLMHCFCGHKDDRSDD